MKYRVFVRTWWKHNAEWPNGLEPSPSRKKTISAAKTEEEARAICADYNAKHDAGRLSRKAEYEAA